MEKVVALYPCCFVSGPDGDPDAEPCGNPSIISDDGYEPYVCEEHATWEEIQASER